MARIWESLIYRKIRVPLLSVLADKTKIFIPFHETQLQIQALNLSSSRKITISDGNLNVSRLQHVCHNVQGSLDYW